MPIPLFDTATRPAPLRERLDAAIARVLDSGRFILGPEVEAFEREFDPETFCVGAETVAATLTPRTNSRLRRVAWLGATDEHMISA